MGNFTDNFAIIFRADTKQAGASIDKLLGLFDKTGDKVKVLRSQMDKLGLEFESTGDDALDLAKNYDKLMQSMQTSSKMSLQEITILSMGISEMGDRISGVNDAVLLQAEQLEQKMANIKATMGSDIDAAGLEALEKQIRQSSVRIGQDADLLAEKVTDALSAGASQETVAQQIELAGKAARGTRGDIDTMVDLGNAVRNTFGEAAGGVENIYDLVSRTYQLGDITGQEIAQGFGFVGGTAKEAGIEINDLFQSIAIGSKKVRPEQLFTGLNAAISELNTSNSKAEKALQSLGYENLQAALETKSFVEIANELNASGIKMVDIFGRQAARAINAVGGSAEDSTKIMAGFADVSEATNQIFADASDTLNFYKQQLAAQQGELKQTIGETMLPLQTEWTRLQTEFLQVMIDTPPALKKVMGLALGTGTALGKTAKFAGEASKNFVAIRDAGSAIQKIDFKGTINGISDAMKKATAAGGGLKTALGTAGLAAAIAFTVGQIIKLSAAIDDYNDAIKSLEDTRANLLDQTKKLAQDKSEEERYALAATELQRYMELLDNAPSKFKTLAKEGVILGNKELKEYNKSVEDSKAQLAALGIIVTENTDLEKELAKALEAKSKIHKRIGEQQKQLNEISEKDNQNKKESIPLTEEQIKALQQLKAAYNQLLESQISSAEQLRRENELNAATEQEAFELREQYLEQDKQTELAMLKERFGNLKNFSALKMAFLANYNQREIALEQEKTAWMTENQIEQGEIDRQRDQERLERLEANQQARLEKTTGYYDQLNAIAGEAANLLGQSLIEGNEKAKEALKTLLQNLVSAVEKQVELAVIGTSAQAFLSGGLTAGQVAGALALKAGFGAIKSAIASFDDGGIPTADGLAMLHKTDVTVNPTTDNPMMSALVDRLAEAVGGGRSVVMNIDGEKVGEVSINHINRRNKQVKPGQDVFEESRWN